MAVGREAPALHGGLTESKACIDPVCQVFQAAQIYKSFFSCVSPQLKLSTLSAVAAQRRTSGQPPAHPHPLSLLAESCPRPVLTHPGCSEHQQCCSGPNMMKSFTCVQCSSCHHVNSHRPGSKARIRTTSLARRRALPTTEGGLQFAVTWVIVSCQCSLLCSFSLQQCWEPTARCRAPASLCRHHWISHAPPKVP